MATKRNFVISRLFSIFDGTTVQLFWLTGEKNGIKIQNTRIFVWHIHLMVAPINMLVLFILFWNAVMFLQGFMMVQVAGQHYAPWSADDLAVRDGYYGVKECTKSVFRVYRI